MNPTIVVDSSALLEVVASKVPDRELLHRLSTAVAAAPELIDVEALSVLRRLESMHALSGDEATAALAKVRAAPIDRVPHRPLIKRAWSLRGSIHAADAFYVALAEELGIPLITCDARLAGSNGHQVDIEVYPVS
ncbi:putative nucleic acid-binding protein [Saccharothrix tamanrassetensis]|uniref:Ribonuclease VapC n=1 Tax=Saccharothrix tamanrassetensis TaxID=1051531 RepID=A0A841C9Z4_9PSEU|nr:type II toxin-antitoxin system VapC family toxin [Saccharothrix tamanrassetensis]MBB5954229.1 putative nucleic acid-binding protein [Saccharothrix tamanrassetensis]